MTLPSVLVADQSSKPFGSSLYISTHTIDFSPLIAQRLQNQTKQVEKGTRTKTTNSTTDSESEGSIRRQIFRKFHEIFKEDQARAPGTAVERKVRWDMGTTAGPGNAANAATAAAAVAKTAATSRAKLFKAAKVSHYTLLSGGDVSQLQKLAIGDFGIV
ncbi:hypothetical protein B0H17DRAFT_1190112 [Mycena rosella]|uniref:Uncharacterized protein n=1 Tax=Mycena rosella TaxID=1033263 RepID=A0AAD7H2V1_MYCRO|nr:hypothetical protein B0H17DRAFT_1190112 [Mycena rosella]